MLVERIIEDLQRDPVNWRVVNNVSLRSKYSCIRRFKEISESKLSLENKTMNVVVSDVNKLYFNPNKHYVEVHLSKQQEEKLKRETETILVLIKKAIRKLENASESRSIFD